ncbi:citryl-CoA lyase [Mesorhizobium sp. WSM4976]|uniref:citryl-CoA lyase n=1 Tax=Mesorhizobium sp. WSM4976 TaxID=3038549 RepID=UPI00241795D5|nr:citryl-CoA lyase [Mesorhizobium sp. WSM4976]MDG4892593.1 citryl-CoA lyase [Mesorhizobium sp. WSM4976]
MTKNTPSHWVSRVSEITSEDIFIRGYPMRSLVGELPFSAISFLLVRGSLPTPGQAKMMDVILSSILDYALHKSGTIAARSIVSVNPRMTAGLAAGMLGAGEYAVSPEDTGRFIAEAIKGWKASDEPMEAAAERIVADYRATKRRIPGFGHQVFRGIDPRAEKLKAIAIRQRVWGEATEFYEAVHRAFQRAANKPDLVLNDVGMLAAIMTQMGFTPPEMTGLALLSTFPGLIAHISEELQSGVVNRIIPDTNADCAQDHRDLARDMKDCGWA